MRLIIIISCQAFCLAFAPMGLAQDQGVSSPPDSDPGEAANSPDEQLDDLEAELAAEMAELEAQQADETNDVPIAGLSMGAPGGVRTARGLSNYFNPALTATGLVLVGGATRSEEQEYQGRGDLLTGIHLQAVGLRFTSIVDPFFRADLAIGAHHGEIHYEEAFLTTLEIPRMALRIGQFYAELGRHNNLHAHAFPFLTAPLPWRGLFGGHGLTDIGLSADILLPLPFFAEINAQVFRGEWGIFEGGVERDGVVTDLREREDFAYVGHLKTLFDFSDSTTIQLGATYMTGRNGHGEYTNVIMGDVTLKWRPTEAERYTGIEWTTEYAWMDRDGAESDPELGGGYTSLRYQFGQQWWLQARGSVLGLPKGQEGRTWRGEALAAYVFSPFSTLRLQYAFETMAESDDDHIHEVFAQMNFSVGPHPAHAY